MYTIDELVDRIAEEWVRSGQVPSIGNPNLPSSSTYYDRFEGGFVEARRYAAEQIGRELVWGCRHCPRVFNSTHARNRHEGWCKRDDI